MYKPIRYKPLDIKPLNLGTYKPKDKPKKQLTYPEARLRFNISPWGDIDKDGRPNWRDCRPYDPNEHLLKELKEAGGKIKEKLKEKGGEVKESLKENLVEPVDALLTDLDEQKEKKKNYKQAMKGGRVEDVHALPFYLIVKLDDGKWYNWGEYPANKINSAMGNARGQPGVVEVRKTKNPEEEKRLNKALTKAIKQERSQQFRQHVKQGAKDVGLTREQILEKIKKGLEIKEQAKSRVGPTMRRIGENASQQSFIRGPPAPSGWWRGSQTMSGQPQTQYIQRRQPMMVQQMPQQMPTEIELTPEQYMELAEMQEPRRVPPGAVPYQPVTREQSSLRYRPVRPQPMTLGMNPNMGRGNTRPRFMMATPQFRFVTFPKITYGRRLR